MPAGQGRAGPHSRLIISSTLLFSSSPLNGYLLINFVSFFWAATPYPAAPESSLLLRLLTNCRIALLLFMATNNFGLESVCHSESLMHGIRDSRVFCVIVASLGPRVGWEWGMGRGKVVLSILYVVVKGSPKWNQMICRATDLCLIYRAASRPDRHANKFRMRPGDEDINSTTQSKLQTRPSTAHKRDPNVSQSRLWQREHSSAEWERTKWTRDWEWVREWGRVRAMKRTRTRESGSFGWTCWPSFFLW